MELKNFASKIVAENSFIKASFGGFAGSGKTLTAAKLLIGCYKKMGLTKPILIVDNEKGSRFLIPLFKEAGIEAYIKETVHLADVLSAFSLLNEKQIDFLFIDTLTKVWYQFTRDYKTNNKRTFLTLQDWGKILPDWQEKFADKFVGLTGNCIFTGRGGYTYDMEENDETKKKEFVKSGVKMKMAGETPFEPDLNIWMDLQQEIGENGKPVIWREAQVLKDRSGLIDGKTFKNPIFKDFEPVIDYLLGTEKGVVAKETDTTNLTATENYDSQNRATKRTIVLEKIKALFTEHQFSTGKEEQAQKVAIIKKFFNTTSQVEIDLMKPEKLEECYDELCKFFLLWPSDKGHADRMKYIVDHKTSLMFNV